MSEVSGGEKNGKSENEHVKGIFLGREDTHKKENTEEFFWMKKIPFKIMKHHFHVLLLIAN